MPLYFSLLFSLVIHAVLIAGPLWLYSTRSKPAVNDRLEIKLLPPPHSAQSTHSTQTTEASQLTEPVDLVTTRPPATPPAVTKKPQRAPADKPQKPTSANLRRAQQKLSEFLLYPPQAIAQGLEGEVVLLLMLDDAGRILSSQVAKSSGHALLDQAALSAAKNLGALPGNPRQTLLPVTFQLQ